MEGQVIARIVMDPYVALDLLSATRRIGFRNQGGDNRRKEDDNTLNCIEHLCKEHG